VRKLIASGRELTADWNTSTSWTAAYTLSPGTNTILIFGYDYWNNVVGTATVSVVYTGTNAWPPLRINEWMASNSGVVRDPADNRADDWFEIFNPTDAEVNLHNWTLTDNLTNVTRFVVPSGYTVPANGYLLVWADNQPEQNTVANRPHLHVNFALERSGEAIGIFAPDSTAVDTVVFGQQQTDITQGRYPNGSIYLGTLQVPTPGSSNIPILPPPMPVVIGRGTAGGNTFELTFPTKEGLQYQIEWRPSLNEGVWSALGPSVMATQSVLMLIDSSTIQTQRFYRVRQMP
jgi:hypothetical protein